MRRSVRARNARIQAINAAKPIRNFKPAEFMHVGSGGHTNACVSIADQFLRCHHSTFTRERFGFGAQVRNLQPNGDRPHLRHVAA